MTPTKKAVKKNTCYICGGRTTPSATTRKVNGSTVAICDSCDTTLSMVPFGNHKAKATKAAA